MGLHNFFPQFTPHIPHDRTKHNYMTWCLDCDNKTEERISRKMADFFENHKMARVCAECHSKNIIWNIKKDEDNE